MQRKMVRFIYGMNPRSHVDQRQFKQLGWLMVNNRVRYFRLVHVFRILKGTAPEYLSRNFTNVNRVHHHNTRGSVGDFFYSGYQPNFVW